MLKSADHLDAVKRLRVSEKDLAPLVATYEVRLWRFRTFIMLIHVLS